MIKSKTLLKENKSIFDWIEEFCKLAYDVLFSVLVFVTAGCTFFLLFELGYLGLAKSLYSCIGWTMSALIAYVVLSIFNSYRKEKCQQKNN